MKNVIILGAARSGTSMLAEVFARSGYFLGPDLLPASEGNPHGYFESREIESINESILGQVIPARPQGRGAGLRQKLFYRKIPDSPGRWLVHIESVPVWSEIASLRERIERLCANEPFCFKDPRFSFTLNYWRRSLPANTVFLCLYRHPMETVASIEKEFRSQGWDRQVTMERGDFIKLWETCYKAALECASSMKQCWCFVHFEQVVSGEAREVIETLVERKLDWTSVDPKLRRSRGEGRALSSGVDGLYRRLNERSGYSTDED